MQVALVMALTAELGQLRAHALSGIARSADQYVVCCKLTRTQSDRMHASSFVWTCYVALPQYKDDPVQWLYLGSYSTC